MHIVTIEALQRELLRVPKLVDRLEQRDQNFPEAVKSCLSQLETILVNHRMSEAAGVAALRAELIASERGVVPASLDFRGRKTSRKVKEATAADVLMRAEQLISGTIRVPMEHIQEGERIARQIVALGKRKGLIPVSHGEGNRTAMLNSLWQALDADPELGNAATHLAGLVGKYDALILLDRMIPGLP